MTKKIQTMALAGALLATAAPALADGDPFPPSGPEKTIVQTAEDAGTFQILVAAIRAAGLEDVLSGDGPFTVFAPTDAAFSALPEGTVASLLLPENRDRLQAILKVHVVAGRLTAEDVAGSTELTTLEGRRLPILVADGTVMVAEAAIVQTDIAASNGVIHVIDSVLLPE